MVGWGKKDKDADLETKKAGLFSKRSKEPKDSKSSKPTSANPYADAVVAPATNNNPYAKPQNGTEPKFDPYVQQSQSSLTQPSVSSFSSQTLNSEQGGPPSYSRSITPKASEKTAVPAGGYGGQTPRYPAQGSNGAAGGYGTDAYGSGSGQSRYGAGGYGGLGRSNSQDTTTTEVQRGALFGDAPQRMQQQQQQQFAPSEQPSDPSYANTGGYDSAEMPGGYGADANRELTAEEQDEQDVQAAKSEIRFIKQQDVASTRNARRIAEQAEVTARETLGRLGAQGDRIHNTERNLDMASNQNILAEEKARELRTLNRSMWAVHVANPFTKNARERAADEYALEKNRNERQQRDLTAKAAYTTTARQQAQQRDLNGSVVRQTNSKSLADRAKYQFEADSEDDEMENEIDENLDQIHHAVGTLRNLGEAMGTELDSQNKHIDRITGKTDKVDDQIAMNRARLDRISKRG